MSKALIFNNKVVDIVETEFEVAPTMTWLDCTSECKTGWTLEDGVLTAPIKIPLTYSQERALQYAPTGDQLDMLWHSIDAGEFGDTAKQSEFYTANKAVKDANPKG
jgi:hypothetical protein